MEKNYKINTINQFINDLSRSIFNLEEIDKRENLLKYSDVNILKKYINIINKRFKIKISFKDFIKEPTVNNILIQISNIALERNKIKKEKESKETIKPIKKKKYYSSSYAQKRMFILHNLEPKFSFYKINRVCELIGNLDILKLQKAVNYIIQRHDSLRTNFKEIKGNVVQIVHNRPKTKVEIINLKNNESINNFIKKIINKSFNLEKDSLIRVTIVKRSKKNKKEDKNILIITLHHIISDAQSLEIFYRELIIVYNAYLNNRRIYLPGLKIQYKDYAAWEQSRSNKTRLLKQEKYWLKLLSGELPILDLPTDYLRSPIQSYSCETEKMVLSKDITKKIKKLAKQRNNTLFILLFTVYNIFLYKISNQDKFIVGTPITNRNHLEIQDVMGVFINNLSIKNDLSNNPKFFDLLQRTKENIVSAAHNGEYPFENLIEKLKIKRDLSRSPIFNVMFQFDAKDSRISKFNNLKFKKIPQINVNTNFDLKFKSIETQKNNIILSFIYNKDLFKQDTIKNFLNIFKILIENIIKDPDKKIDEFDTINQKEANRIIKQFTGQKIKYSDLTINELFEEQVLKNPKKIVVEFAEQQLSYQELNRMVNKLACYLSRVKKIRKGRVVSIFLDRSIDSVVSILGVLKTGACFVPIDTSYPKKRINHIFKDADSSLLITTKDLFNKLPRITKQKVLRLDQEGKEIEKIFSKNLNIKLKKDDLASIIYTSGSTGNPKGVMLTQGGIVNYTYTKLNALEKRNRSLKKEEIVAQTAPVGYVISIWQMFVPIVSGAKLIIYGNETIKDVGRFFRKIDEDKVNLIQIVPSFLWSYLDIAKANNKYSKLTSLKEIQLTGEITPPALANNFYKKYKIPLVNVYGSSEISDDALHYEIPKQTDQYRILSGKPIMKEVYIVDNNLKPIPRGIIGEIYVGGENLSKGYLNNKDKTKKAFLCPPFRKGKRIYKMGDLARMCEDGNIEVIGRNDYQVNIHGNRIELGEIEFNLQKHSDVERCIVTTKNDVLIAYYTAKNKITPENLREYLREILPEYMIPTIFVYLKEFPLNAHGKIDRQSLPEPKEGDMGVDEYKSPQTDREKKVAEIWQEVLNIKTVGLNDNFFHLGGHSLKAIQVLARINKKFKIDLSLKDLFKNFSIRKLVKSVKINKAKGGMYLIK